MAVADLPPASKEWRMFPSAVRDAPAIRLDASKYLAEGVYRKITACATTYYIHVADFVDGNAACNMDLDACADEYIARAGAPVSEVVVSGGTRLLLAREIAIYGGEPVGSTRSHGILICGSRY